MMTQIETSVNRRRKQMKNRWKKTKMVPLLRLLRKRSTKSRLIEIKKQMTNSLRRDFWSSNSNNNKLLSKPINSSKKRPISELNYNGFSKKWSKEWLSVVTSWKKRNLKQLKNRESSNSTQNKRRKNKEDFQRKKSVRRLSCSKKNKVTTRCKRRLKTVEKSSKSSDKNTKV